MEPAQAPELTNTLCAPICRSCHFYRLNPKDLKQGSCRFNPPAGMVIPGPSGQPIVMSIFPPTSETEWCGKWQTK